MPSLVTAASIPASQPKIDCHVHVFDPVRFPYAADTFYRPTGHEVATADQLLHTMDSHGVQYALIVGPNSGYGFDNRCLLDALERGAGRFKGAAVVPNHVSREELQALKAAGVIGVTLNVALLGVDYFRDAATLLGHLRELDMLACVQVQFDELPLMQGLLLDSGVRMVFDHLGRPNPTAGVAQPGFAALLALAECGRASVKLSSLVKSSQQPFPHQDAWPYVQTLIDTFGTQQLMWGSDWPFLRAPARIDYGPLLDVFAHLVPDASMRQTILWDTPKRLFGFA